MSVGGGGAEEVEVEVLMVGVECRGWVCYGTEVVGGGVGSARQARSLGVARDEGVGEATTSKPKANMESFFLLSLDFGHPFRLITLRVRPFKLTFDASKYNI